MVSTHLKSISQIGNHPQVGVKIKNLWNHHLDTIHGKNPWVSRTSPIRNPSTHQPIVTKAPVYLKGMPIRTNDLWGFVCRFRGGGSWFHVWIYIYIYGCFQKWWYPTTMSFPTKNDHFGVFWGYHYFWKHPYTNAGTVGVLVFMKKKGEFFGVSPRYFFGTSQFLFWWYVLFEKTRNNLNLLGLKKWSL